MEKEIQVLIQKQREALEPLIREVDKANEDAKLANQKVADTLKRLDKVEKDALILIKEKALKVHPWKAGDRFKVRGFDTTWYIDRVEPRVKLVRNKGYKGRQLDPKGKVDYLVYAQRYTKSGYLYRNEHARPFHEKEMLQAEKV